MRFSVAVIMSLFLIVGIASCKQPQALEELSTDFETTDIDTTSRISSQAHLDNLWKKRAEKNMVIHVYGNEPFWSLEVYADSMLFSTPDFRRPLVLMGPFDIVKAAHLVLRGTHEGGEGILVLAEGPCMDNMSDNTHSYQAQLDLNDFISGTTMQLGGCGNWVADKVGKEKP